MRSDKDCSYRFVKSVNICWLYLGVDNTNILSVDVKHLDISNKEL